MFGIEGIEPVEFRPGVLNAEAPVDDGLGFISLPLQGVDFPAEGFLSRDSLPEAVAGEDAELYLRHIEPTAMLGGVEPDAPIEVKSWFELFGPRSVGQRRLRELRIV